MCRPLKGWFWVPTEPKSSMIFFAKHGPWMLFILFFCRCFQLGDCFLDRFVSKNSRGFDHKLWNLVGNFQKDIAIDSQSSLRPSILNGSDFALDRIDWFPIARLPFFPVKPTMIANILALHNSSRKWCFLDYLWCFCFKIFERICGHAKKNNLEILQYLDLF